VFDSVGGYPIRRRELARLLKTSDHTTEAGQLVKHDLTIRRSSPDLIELGEDRNEEE
jgi:hypothetical protein